MKRILDMSSESASYCCESAYIINAGELPKEDAFGLKHKLESNSDSASYCCESAYVINAEDLPAEDAF